MHCLSNDLLDAPKVSMKAPIVAVVIVLLLFYLGVCADPIWLEPVTSSDRV